MALVDGRDRVEERRAHGVDARHVEKRLRPERGATGLRHGYGGPPKLQRRRKSPRESERGWGPASIEKRLRPERGAPSPRESERGWGPASIEKGDTRMRVLAVDIGGTNVKILAIGQKTPRKFPSGRKLTPKKMVAGVKALAWEWKYDAVAIGYPGRVHGVASCWNRKTSAAHGSGSISSPRSGGPVQVINDAAMQALGSDERGLLLFLGLGTGLGAALVADGVVIPMELAHLSFKNGTYEDYLGVRALRRLGRKKWQKYVEVGTARMIEALHPDDVVLGGGNAQKLKKLPKGYRLGNNAYAFIGGFRLWENASSRRPPAPGRSRRAA